MNRKQRRAAGDRQPPIPTAFDKPIRAIPIDPNAAPGSIGAPHQCVGVSEINGLRCPRDAEFVLVGEKDGSRWGFPACKEHARPIGELLDAGSPRAEPRADMADCAEDMTAGLNALGFDPDLRWAEDILNRGGVHVMPCPVCSGAGIDTHLLRVHKDGDQFSVEAVAL